MNSDIRISTAFFQHHKTKKLMRKLGADGIVYLLKLWMYAAQSRPDGALTDMSEEDIAIAVDWDDEPAVLVGALCDVGFLDQLEDGTYSIHDWEDNNPYAAGASERSAKAKAAANARWGNSSSQAKPKKTMSNAKVCSEHATSNAGSINEQCPSPSLLPSSPSPEESLNTNTSNTYSRACDEPQPEEERQSVCEKSESQVQEKKSVHIPGPVDQIYSPEFEEFMGLYDEEPNDGAWSAWKAVCVRRNFSASWRDNLADWIGCERWQSGYKKDAKNFLRDGDWQRKPPAQKTPQAQVGMGTRPQSVSDTLANDRERAAQKLLIMMGKNNAETGNHSTGNSQVVSGLSLGKAGTGSNAGSSNYLDGRPGAIN